MAQKAIREFDAKNLIINQWSVHWGERVHTKTHSVLVDAQNIPKKSDLLQSYPWLKNTIVVKPDELFGKRFKNGLVKVGIKLESALNWIKEKSTGVTQLLSGKQGVLRYFLLEEAVKHSQEEEWYVSLMTIPEGVQVHLSKSGGVDIEENWESSVQTFCIPTLADQALLLSLCEEHTQDDALVDFLLGLYHCFVGEDFAYLELNPFVLRSDTVYLLDCVARLDDTAGYLHNTSWSTISFPRAFGEFEQTEQEKRVEEIDSKSGASLKLSILNRGGDIFPLFSGGGASVTLSDLLAEAGIAKRLALYGEYSGNPTRYETEQYTKAVLELLLSSAQTKHPKTLLIAGGIANFTDIYQTFLGIIDAIESERDKLTSIPLRLVIRRGGPNADKGLAAMGEMCKRLSLDYSLYDHTTDLATTITEQFSSV